MLRNQSLAPSSRKAVSIYFRNIDSYLCKALKTEVNQLNYIYIYIYLLFSHVFMYHNFFVNKIKK